MKNTHSGIPKQESWQMFNQISPRYDLLNRLLAWGLDISWRKRLSQYLPKRDGLRLVDLATGTADVPLFLVQTNPQIAHVSGVDMAEKMLDVGRGKIERKTLQDKIELFHGDANAIPFEDTAFDGVTMAFGIRNVKDPTIVFKEMLRVLKPQGRALILEFSIPKNPILKLGHLFYLRHIVPAVGWLVSGHYKAYKYLNQTIEDFPYGQDFTDRMESVGFQNAKANTLLGGVATIYQGDKV